MTEPVIPLRPRCTTEPHLGCPTCADEGLPARVVAVDAATDRATVKIEGGEREVALDLLDDIHPGDFILVHLDIALAKLNPADVVVE